MALSPRLGAVLALYDHQLDLAGRAIHMVRSILVGLDGSAYSTNATELGIRWASQFGALLVGIGVVDEATIRGPELVPLTGVYNERGRDDVRTHEAQRQVEQLLEGFALRCADAASLPRFWRTLACRGSRSCWRRNGTTWSFWVSGPTSTSRRSSPLARRWARFSRTARARS